MDNKDLEFSEAMQLKLRLNREKRNSQDSGASLESSEPSEQTGGSRLRASIAQRVMRRHPGLTQQQVEQMMERDGF